MPVKLGLWRIKADTNVLLVIEPAKQSSGQTVFKIKIVFKARQEEGISINFLIQLINDCCANCDIS